jgi:RNA polymerase sigma factor (sigma-70 family)
LWRLLITIATRKVSHHLRDEGRKKRGRPNTVVLDESSEIDFDQFPSQDPTPDFVIQLAEEYERLLDLLRDPKLRSIAVWKTEGFTVEEIAKRLKCVPRTVERRLQLIRLLWEKELIA